jgi:hypothetical protein
MWTFFYTSFQSIAVCKIVASMESFVNGFSLSFSHAEHMRPNNLFLRLALGCSIRAQSGRLLFPGHV